MTRRQLIDLIATLTAIADRMQNETTALYTTIAALKVKAAETEES